jgi:hypothetical protein
VARKISYRFLSGEKLTTQDQDVGGLTETTGASSCGTLGADMLGN